MSSTTMNFDFDTLSDYLKSLVSYLVRTFADALEKAGHRGIDTALDWLCCAMPYVFSRA